MASTISQPELYWAKPTPHCPNSDLPILVYRNVLPENLGVESTEELFEANNWVNGGVFKHFPTAHFHSNTHECYAAIRGTTKWVSCLYGVGPLDEPSNGVTFDMQAGDIAVHAAGVAHRNVESSPDYEYMGLYPRGAPHWDNNYCKADREETEEKQLAAEDVPVPEYDPIYGRDGPLPRIWKGVTEEKGRSL